MIGWVGAGLAAAAVGAEVAARRRRRRADLDRVGWVDWPTVQMLAMLGAAFAAALAMAGVG